MSDNSLPTRQEDALNSTAVSHTNKPPQSIFTVSGKFQKEATMLINNRCELYKWSRAGVKIDYSTGKKTTPVRQNIHLSSAGPDKVLVSRQTREHPLTEQSTGTGADNPLTEQSTGTGADNSLTKQSTVTGADNPLTKQSTVTGADNSLTEHPTGTRADNSLTEQSTGTRADNPQMSDNSQADESMQKILLTKPTKKESVELQSINPQEDSLIGQNTEGKDLQEDDSKSQLNDNKSIKQI